RLPRETLKHAAANCIDGAVLFASMLEGVSLGAALLLVPGHALVGWESARGKGDWQVLETTMISTHDFDSACESGQKQYQIAAEFSPERLALHRLADLRARGIWPMEGRAPARAGVRAGCWPRGAPSIACNWGKVLG